MSQEITSNRKKAKRSRYFDYIVSICAVLISICAFSVSYYQTQVLKKQTEIMQEQMHANVWPRLFLSQRNNAENFELHLQNDGVGPAIIKSVEVCVDGKPYKDWRHAITELTNSKNFRLNLSFINNRTIRSGEDVCMFKITNKEIVALIQKNQGRLSIEICYGSIYDQLWKLNYDRNSNKGFPIPVPIEQINFVEERQFLN